YKSVAVNVSDIAAMNGKPEQITVGLALSSRFSVEAVDAFYEGVAHACRDYGIDLIGGDTTASPTGMMVSVTVRGVGDKDKIAYRRNAEVNDIICVTGDLGGALMGLQVLEREKAGFKANPDIQPEIQQYEYVVGRQLKPRARMDMIFDFEEL